MSHFAQNSKGFKRIINAAKFSKDGLTAAWQGEAAFRQLIVLNSILIFLALALSFSHFLSNLECAVLIVVSFFSLIVELLNSAIEAAIDRISLELHPLSKNAKDMGSAAQLLAMFLLAITWALILFK